MSVIKISDYKPHVSIQVGVNVHIFPLSVFEDIVSGDIEIDDIDDWRDIIPVIVGEWINQLTLKGLNND